MTLTAWDIYWVTRLDEISIALGLAITALLIVLALSTFVYFVTEFEIKGAKKLACGLVPWIIGLALVNTFIPNTKQAAAMIVLPAIVNSEAVQQIPGELTTLAREWLQELRPAKKGGSK